MTSENSGGVVVGLVGGIAAGKSYVATALKEMGAVVIDADDMAHNVLQKPLVARTLVRQFGPSIADEQGNINRRALAKLVFGSDATSMKRRQLLEDLVHPMIHAEVVHRLRELNEQANGPPSMVVIDAPLLLEAGWKPMCDAIIFVDAPESIRQVRAIERGWTLADFESREGAQMELADKRVQATHVVDNQDAQALRSQLQQIWSEILT